MELVLESWRAHALAGRRVTRGLTQALRLVIGAHAVSLVQVNQTQSQTSGPCSRTCLPNPSVFLSSRHLCARRCRNFPGSSPASYPTDTSFLQQAVAQGRLSLSESLEPPHGDDRGRSYRRIRTGRGRSASTSYSESGSHLSVTEEGDSEDEVDPNEISVDVDGGIDGSVQSGSHYAYSGGAPILLPSGPSSSRLDVATESTPLLTPSSTSTIALDREPLPSLARQELKILLGFMLPICGTHFLEYSLLVVTVISVGHIGTVELAAASLASMTSNVVALSVIQGFCTALGKLRSSPCVVRGSLLTSVSRYRYTMSPGVSFRGLVRSAPPADDARS